MKVDMDKILASREENEIPKEISDKKLWNPKGFIIFSILFSFFPTGILYSLNYGRMGNKKKRNKLLLTFTLLVVVVSTLSIKFSYLDEKGILKGLFFCLDLGLGIFMKKSQLQYYQKHINNGGKKASYVIPSIICIILAIVIIIPLVYIAIRLPFIENDSSVIINGDELFYSDKISLDEANRLVEYLEYSGLFIDDGNDIFYRIDKDKDVYMFSIIILEELKDDEILIDGIKSLSQDLSDFVFDNSKVIIRLCDEEFNAYREVSY